MDALDVLMACPRCGASHQQGFSLSSLMCHACDATFFELQGLRCLFPSGLDQKALWDDLFAKVLLERDQMIQANRVALNQPGISQMTAQRVQAMATVQLSSFSDLENLLTQIGMQPKSDDRFNSFSAKAFIQYYELMLRDWAWKKMDHSDAAYRPYEDENQQALASLLSILKDESASSCEHSNSPNMLVVGSGAGRLSWDLCCALQPHACVALDFNPLLSFAAHHIIQQQGSLMLSEARRFPHASLPSLHQWQLKMPSAKQLGVTDAQYQRARQAWVGMCADFWYAPFQASSFDVIVTPWFLDINGRDVKELLAQVTRLLKPGGSWINYGPLLYPEGLPFNKQYTYLEINDLAKKSGLQMRNESFQTLPYLYSPLNERGRMEEVWCACFDYVGAESTSTLPTELKYQFTSPPDWYLLPHLSVPKLPLDWVPEDMHGIAMLFDGNKSMQDIASMLSPILSTEHDPLNFTYGFIQEYYFDKSGSH